MNIISSKDLDLIVKLTSKINVILKSFKNIKLQLVDFKLEFGYDLKRTYFFVMK